MPNEGQPQSDPGADFDRMVVAAMDKLIELRDHPGWKILMLSFAEDRDSAITDLLVCDPADVNHTRDLQNRARMLQDVASRLDHLIISGSQPEILREAEAEEFDG